MTFNARETEINELQPGNRSQCLFPYLLAADLLFCPLNDRHLGTHRRRFVEKKLARDGSALWARALCSSEKGLAADWAVLADMICINVEYLIYFVTEPTTM